MSKGENAAIVHSAADFYDVAKAAMPNVTVLHITSAFITQFIKAHDPWANVLEVPGISKIHAMECIDVVEIKLYRTNLDLGSSVSVAYTSDKLDDNNKTEKHVVIQSDVGHWVIVQYDGKRFPGEVTRVVGEDTQVSVMKQARSGNWKWPLDRDVLDYKPKDVVCVIEPPVPVGMIGGAKDADVLFSYSEKTLDLLNV